MDLDLSPDDTIMIDLTRLFDVPITDGRTLIPTSTDVIRDVVTGKVLRIPVPDDTFHGILPQPSAVCTLRGDADGSGEVNILDAILMARVLVGTDPQPSTSDDLCRLDANNDSTVDIQDIILILGQVTGL
jgi:hypothetical protein